ncbi:hypothetical protein ACIBH1_36985 [Nonomuraea sp. NPDC050663]|uniref:hypothetical protein n=1 Tax=Nonomuraea sp. NPDC050663 TaxID=3364370 RepID=UPI0037B73F13
MDKKLKIETIAFVLLLLAFPIISVGTTQGSAPVWWAGMVALLLGGVLPIWTRYMDHSADKPRDMGMEFDDRVS